MSRILAIGHIAQEKENWCWAATTSAVRNYYHPGHQVSQRAMVIEILESDVDEQHPASNALAHYGHLQRLEYNLTFDVVQREIDAHRPIVLSDGAHSRLLRGYTLDPDGTQWAYVLDPEHGGSLEKLRWTVLLRDGYARSCAYLTKPATQEYL